MVKQKSLTIAHLYPTEMNIYGDTGNVLLLQKRLEWRDFKVEVVPVHPGDKLPKNADLLVSGGGQDTGQITVCDDLQKKKQDLQKMAEDGVTMLVICGTFQLFGHRFVPHDQEELPGISIFDAETIAGDKRLIGNIVTESDFGLLVGYENHSGLTTLLGDQQHLGWVKSGEGNNTADPTEGAITKNVFGTYLHGPILPKNPHFADELLTRALARKYGKVDLEDLDDEGAKKAARIAAKRPR